ncbi:MAG: TolC family protein [Verrucomicrobia bacterium]|nr:TolC family protein [Verrucomicrobiota bacterium]
MSVALGCLVVAANAQSPNPAPRPLSLRECVELALEHNLDVQIERYNPELARVFLQGAYGVYDPVFNVRATHDSLKSPALFAPRKFNPDFPYDLRTDSVGAGFTGLLPTGLTYDFSGRSDFLDADTDFTLDPDTARFFRPDGIRRTNQYFLSAGITLRQPLLRDSWIDGYRQAIRVNKKNLKISELALRWRIMNTVTAVQQAYYELLYAREQVKVEERALDLANQLRTETRRRVEVGDLPPLDEKQAEAQVEATQADLIAAQQVLAERRNALVNLLTDDFRAWADVAPEPTEHLAPLADVPDRAECWQRAMTSRPDLAQFRAEIEKLDLSIRFNFNQLFPNLDLVGSFGGRAAEDTFGRALDTIADGQNPAYGYGVVLRVPVGNRTARSNYRASKAVREQTQLHLKKLEQSVLVEVDNAVKAVQSAFKRMNSTRQARVFAEAALAAEKKKLQNGASTSFTVLQFQERLTAAQTAEIRALADYHKALAQLALSEGSTLEKLQLSVEIR